MKRFVPNSLKEKVNVIKEPGTQMLMINLPAREFAQFISDNIGEVLTDNVAQEK